MAIFHCHFPHAGVGKPKDHQGSTCPCVSFPSMLCNLGMIIYHCALRCDGKSPSDACPLGKDSTVMLSMQKPSEMRIVTP